MIFFIAHDKIGHSALDLTRKLDIGYRAAWTLSHKIRTAMAARDANYKLSGLIELDDAYFGPKNAPGKRGRGADKKATVIVSAQVTSDNNPRYASMTVVDNLKEESVKEATEINIEKGSRIKTDGYSSLKTLDKNGYEHVAKVIGDPSNASIELPWVHIFIANAKSMIRGTYKGVGAKYMQHYLDEFCYRLNRRFNVNEIFNRLLIACVLKDHISIAELRA
jgi:hypothetical protein